MLDNELKKILEEKEFNNFWEAYDYLLLTGYSEIDGFGICLEVFGENKIWDDVAFVRGEPTKLSNTYIYNTNATNIVNQYILGVDTYNDNERETLHEKSEIVVGVINKDTEHLRKIFRFYLESCSNDVVIFDTTRDVEEFEALCNERYTFKLPKLIIEYLTHTSKLHYGFDVFNNKQNKRLSEVCKQYPIDFDSAYTTTTND
jgi:hypothetical protein